MLLMIVRCHEPLMVNLRPHLPGLAFPTAADAPRLAAAPEANRAQLLSPPECGQRFLHPASSPCLPGFRCECLVPGSDARRETRTARLPRSAEANLQPILLQ